MRLAEIVVAGGQRRYLVLDDDGAIVEPIARYLKHLDRRGYKRNTLRTYGTGLKFFFEFLGQKRVDYQQISLDDMADFVHWLKLPYRAVNVIPAQPVEQARANSTINHYLTAIAGFYDYLWRRDQLTADVNTLTRQELPARSRSFKGFLHGLAQDKPVERKLLKQPQPKRRPKTLSKQQVEQLVAACNTERDRLLVTLLYESSLRIGEALNLWIEDIDISRAQLHVVDRGELSDASIKTPSAVRDVDVSQELINQILDYVAVAHTEEVETNQVFLKMHGPNAGKPLAYADVHDLFKRLKGRTGIDAWPHLLRHSSLTALARAGFQPEHLQKRAGHAQFQYTYDLYVHPTEEDLREEWERTQQQVRLSTSPHQEDGHATGGQKN